MERITSEQQEAASNEFDIFTPYLNEYYKAYIENFHHLDISRTRSDGVFTVFFSDNRKNAVTLPHIEQQKHLFLVKTKEKSKS